MKAQQPDDSRIVTIKTTAPADGALADSALADSAQLLDPEPGFVARQLNKFQALELPQQALLLASLCYVVGFVITNFHLALYGIVSVELLRFRYISTGFMFVVYFGLAWLAIYYFRKTYFACLRSRKGADWAGLVFYAGVLAFGALMLAWGLELITGPTYRPPVVIPDILQPDFWFGQLRGTLFWVVLIAVISIAVYARKRLWRKLAAKLVHTKFGQRRGIKVPNHGATLSGILRDNFTPIWWGIVATIMGLLVVLTTYASGWWRFSASMFTIFMAGALYTVYPMIVHVFGNVQKLLDAWGTPPDDEHPAEKHSLNLVSMLFPAIALVLIYLRLVYPDIPQQLGGGSMLPVRIAVSKEILPPQLAHPDAHLFLLDRTSDDSIFYVSALPPFARLFIQVPNSNIDAVVYRTR